MTKGCSLGFSVVFTLLSFPQVLRENFLLNHLLENDDTKSVWTTVHVFLERLFSCIVTTACRFFLWLWLAVFLLYLVLVFLYINWSTSFSYVNLTHGTRIPYTKTICFILPIFFYFWHLDNYLLCTQISSSNTNCYSQSILPFLFLGSWLHLC